MTATSILTARELAMNLTDLTNHFGRLHRFAEAFPSRTTTADGRDFSAVSLAIGARQDQLLDSMEIGDPDNFQCEHGALVIAGADCPACRARELAAEDDDLPVAGDCTCATSDRYCPRHGY